MRPVVFNPSGINSVPAVQAEGYPGTLLGCLGEVWMLADGHHGIPGLYVALERFTLGDTVPVATDAMLYFADGRFSKGQPLYVGPAGEITTQAPARVQQIGIATDAHTVHIALAAARFDPDLDPTSTLFLAEMVGARLGLESLTGVALSDVAAATLEEYGEYHGAPWLSEARALRVGLEVLSGEVFS